MLVNLFAFILAIVILVGIHEFGHFWVARRLGIKVLRFSIGFGKPLWRWCGKQDQTEYVLAAIPLGGYVKMLDEREGPVAAEERHRAFNRQSIPARAAVVAAGPLINLLFAVFAFAGAALWGETGLRPWVGAVMPNSPAAVAGMQMGDEILQVNDTPTPTWGLATQALALATLQQTDLRVQVRDTQDALVWREFATLAEISQPHNLLTQLGLQPKQPQLPAVIGQVLADSAAEQAGLQIKDRVLAVDGTRIPDWAAWVKTIQAHPNVTLELMIERDGVEQNLLLTPAAHRRGDQTIGLIGVLPTPPNPALLAEYQVTYRLSPWEAFITASVRTIQMIGLTGQVIWQMLVGQASVDHLSGPLSIANAAGQTAQHGVAAFLKFLGLISISLGVLNLLPIPVLDGGHLVYLGLEAVRGKPVPEAWLEYGQKLGLAVLGSLMVLVFLLDIQRFW